MPMLVLNRRRLLNALPKWFLDSRAELIVLTDRSALAGARPDEVAPRFRELVVVDDYTAPPTAEQIYQLARKFGVERILTTAESDVLRAARIRRRLGLPGQGVDSARAYRDKYVMKSHAAASGVPVAPMRLVSTGSQLVEFAEEQKFPFVVKPVDAASSIGMVVVEDRVALASLIASWEICPPAAPQLAEVWIESEMYHVDGVMADGVVLQSRPCRYLYTQWASTSRSAPLISGMLPENSTLSAELRRSAAQVVSALPSAPGACAFHAEFFRPQGRVMLCEIACRAGGGGVVEAYQWSSGINLYEAQLKGQAGRTSELSFDRPLRHNGHGSWFPPQYRALLKSMPWECSLPRLDRYAPVGAVGAVYDGPDNTSHRVADAWFGLSGDVADVVAGLEAADAWWNANVRWEPR